ncbi:MAG: gamma-glutamylcyclotransferase [Armatimonadetes bacterium]|nr:gamma-glutamylcyclotransferase [Armatimonadota bacterium]
MPSLYFAYGSNLSLDQMRSRCADSRPVRSHFLEGHELVLRGAANIEDREGSRIPGAIYEISQDDEIRLDGYESCPNVYMKLYFETDLGPAMYYRMVEPTYRKPREGYVETIATGYGDWGLPAEHLEAAIEAERLRGGQ